MMKKTLAVSMLVFSFSLPATAGGGGFTGGSTELTQMMNNVELVSIYSSEIQQLQQQMQMYANMYQNTVGLPMQAWGSVESQLRGLVNAVSSVQGVVGMTENALAQIEQQFGNGTLMDRYENRLADWRKGLNNTIGSVLGQYGLQAARFSTTQGALAQIQAASQSATGRMQVLQAGNQISGLMVNQLMDLQSTIMAAEQARLNHIAIQESEKQQNRLRQLEFLRKAEGKW